MTSIALKQPTPGPILSLCEVFIVATRISGSSAPRLGFAFPATYAFLAPDLPPPPADQASPLLPTLPAKCYI